MQEHEALGPYGDWVRRAMAEGEFYDGPHKFDRAMQASAFAHLGHWLRVSTT